MKILTNLISGYIGGVVALSWLWLAPISFTYEPLVWPYIAFRLLTGV